MEKFTQKEGTFSLFKATEKKQEKSPDFTGKAVVNGNELRLSGWSKKSQSGEVYISGYIEEPAPKPATTEEVDSFLGAPKVVDVKPNDPVDELPNDLPF
jgi:hypothetical protein